MIAGVAVTPLAIGITGASGFLGGALASYLAGRGHRIVRFVRHASRAPGEVSWSPAGSALDPRAVETLDAVVNLSGATIGGPRWTAARKRELIESRVQSTSVLAQAIARASSRPALVSASAVGIYGDRGDELLDDSSLPGHGFLADLARQWEAAAYPARSAGARVVHPRMGLVLAAKGGVLERILPMARAGLGGPLGNGRQWWSWISLRDVLALFTRAIESDKLAGPLNVVAPQPIRQGDFARALGRALSRRAILPAPAFALQLMLGREQADELLLASTRVRPSTLERLGFTFQDPELEPALARMLAS